MRRVVIREHGPRDRLVLEETDLPEPGPGQVRVRLRAVGLNHLDVWVRRGVEGARFPLPIVPSSDGAGVIDAVGAGADGVEVGDRVVVVPGSGCGRCAACASGQEPLCAGYRILGESCDGTCREAMLLTPRQVLPLPAGLSFAEGASFALTFLTAWHMVVGRADLKPHETILVHAAASGVSSAAIQIARLIGARILATAGSEAKLQHALDLGADEVIPYRAVDFVPEVRKLTGKRGVDVVIDHVGQDTLPKSLRSLARGGRLVTCGGTSGPKLETDVRLVFFKGLSILGSTMGSLGELCRVVQHFERGTFRAVVDRVLPFAEVAEGHRILEEREVIGKVVLSMEDAG